jgi:hypothetical protein
MDGSGSFHTLIKHENLENSGVKHRSVLPAKERPRHFMKIALQVMIDIRGVLFHHPSAKDHTSGNDGDKHTSGRYRVASAFKSTT